MICPNCRNETSPEHAFCARCGRPVSSATPPREPPTPSELGGESAQTGLTPPEPPVPSPSPEPDPSRAIPSERLASTKSRSLWIYGLVAVAATTIILAASFGISVLVVEWRGSGGSNSIRVDAASEWVACQAKVANSILEDDPAAGEGFLTEGYIERIKGTCDITKDLWVFCVNGEFLKLSDAELESFGARRASDIADSCREELR